MSQREKKGAQGFTAEERAAMKERAKELKAEARANQNRADGERDLLAKIAELPEPERAEPPGGPFGHQFGVAVRAGGIDADPDPTLSPVEEVSTPGNEAFGAVGRTLRVGSNRRQVEKFLDAVGGDWTRSG